MQLQSLYEIPQLPQTLFKASLFPLLSGLFDNPVFLNNIILIDSVHVTLFDGSESKQKHSWRINAA